MDNEDGPADRSVEFHMSHPTLPSRKPGDV
jgi:hypothetical protein